MIAIGGGDLFQHRQALVAAIVFCRNQSQRNLRCGIALAVFALQLKLMLKVFQLLCLIKLITHTCQVFENVELEADQSGFAWEVFSAPGGIGDPGLRYRVSQQKLRRSFIKAVCLEHSLKHAGHGIRVEAGANQRLHTDTVGFALPFAAVGQLILNRCRLACD